MLWLTPNAMLSGLSDSEAPLERWLDLFIEKFNSLNNACHVGCIII